MVLLQGGGGGVRGKALLCGRTLLQRAAGGGGKGGGGKGGAGGGKAPAKAKKTKVEAPVGPTVEKELRAKAVLGANILKEGSDPPVRPDSEYPPWLLSLLSRSPPLSELERRDPTSMSVLDLHRFVKLDNRRRVKENNALKAKS